MEPGCFALCFSRKAHVLFPIQFSPEIPQTKMEVRVRSGWPEGSELTSTSTSTLLHPYPYCNVLPAGLSLTGARSPVLSPEEAIALFVISWLLQTRLPKTLGRNGDDDCDYAVSTIYQAWFSGPCGHMSLSKTPISSRLCLLHIFCMRELRLRVSA